MQLTRISERKRQDVGDGWAPAPDTGCVVVYCFVVMVLLWFCCQRRTRDDPRNPMDLCMLRLTGRIRRIQRWTGRYESPENVVESEGNRGRERRGSEDSSGDGREKSKRGYGTGPLAGKDF